MHRFGLLGRNPAYRVLWSARTISFFGDAVANVALVLYIYGRDGAGTAVGLLLLAQALPRLLGPFAGALADRVDGRRLMPACELGQALLFGAIALFLPPLPVLLGLVLAAATLATLFLPAGRGAVPVLVPAPDLPGANALLGAGLNASLALGPALGGLLIAGVSLQGVLLIDGLSFLLSAALLSRLPARPPVLPDGTAESFLATTRAGLAYVLQHPTARAVMVGLFLVVAFAALDNVALVFLAKEAFGAGDMGYGILAAAYGVGMVLAQLALIRWGGRLAPVAGLLLGIALTGGGALLTGLAPALVVAIAAQGIAGGGNGLENVANDTLIGRTVPRALLGRVFGTVYTAAFLASSLAYAAGGPLLDLTSPRVVFLIAGGGVLAALLIVWLILPRPLKQLESEGAAGIEP